MIRLPTVLWMFVMVVAVFLLYAAKYEVQGVRAQIADTSQKLKEQKEALHVVAAEWAYLNRPERLQALANKYLSPSAVTVDQIAELEAIPFPQQQVAGAASGIQPVSARMESPVEGE